MLALTTKYVQTIRTNFTAMATLSAVVFKHQKKSDGTFPVKIRIIQFSKPVYLPIDIFAPGKFIDPKYKMKTAFIEAKVTEDGNFSRSDFHGLKGTWQGFMPSRLPGIIASSSVFSDGDAFDIDDVDYHLGVSRRTLSMFVNGHLGISAEMALRLSKALGTTPELWLNMQQSFVEHPSLFLLIEISVVFSNFIAINVYR